MIKPIPSNASTAEMIEKNCSGRYVLKSRRIVKMTFIPSDTVFSLLTLPSGRSRYSMTSFSTNMFLSAAWIVISVSISKPFDRTGKDFTY